MGVCSPSGIPSGLPHVEYVVHDQNHLTLAAVPGVAPILQDRVCMVNSSLFSLYKELFDTYPALVPLSLQRESFHTFYTWHGGGRKAGRSIDAAVMDRCQAQGFYP